MGSGSTAPDTALFAVREAAGAGRGAFARADGDIAAGTSIHLARDLTAHVLLREYRGEVCWECFAYDRGKRLPLRHADHGFALCSRECEARLAERYDEVCLQAWAAVEKVCRSKAQASSAHLVSEQRPSISAIDAAWDVAVGSGTSILEARLAGTRATKAHRRTLQHALSVVPCPDVLGFQLHAVLLRYQKPDLWSSILQLAEDPCPYATCQDLDDHVKSYRQLLAVLPQELLPLVTPDTLRTVKEREAHNSFGIRSLEDGGSEFFGFGVWPSASYFNHSCRPNVKRHRHGRGWEFKAACDIPAGQQLYISYLNGEEDTLTTQERRARLSKTWGFNCACSRCAPISQ